MRTRLAPWSLAIAVSGLALLAWVAPAATSAAPLRPLASLGAPAEPHPEIRAAIGALERARYRLQHAAHDFGGHRVAAIAAIDEALKQLRLALEYDKD